MVKLTTLSLLAAALLAGCTKPNNATCADDYCQDETLPFCDKDGFLEGTENTCIAVECTPNELVACHTASEAYYCNATGNDINVSPCANGCDEAMGGCIDEIIVEEECIANTVECDGNVVKRCSADNVLSVEACDVSCISDPEPHCAYLEPKYLPDICDVPATGHVDFGPFDTNIDSQCTGGIVTQVDGPEICVVRAGTITVPDGVEARVSGRRVLALVGDRSLEVRGVIDISADGLVSGPGGGFVTAGNATTSSGAGGAGYYTSGGDGGARSGDGAAANGGAPLGNLGELLVGGPGGKSARFTAPGGGGGGAALLVACRGSVTVRGVLDAGGGGGSRGGQTGASQFEWSGGAGGGAGGMFAIEGLNVQILGRMFANGGGGGSGAPGLDGGDARRAVGISAQPDKQADEGVGGAGGAKGSLPAPGKADVGTAPIGAPTSGGGGGSVGVFYIRVPSGVVPPISPIEISPNPLPVEEVRVR